MATLAAQATLHRRMKGHWMKYGGCGVIWFDVIAMEDGFREIEEWTLRDVIEKEKERKLRERVRMKSERRAKHMHEKLLKDIEEEIRRNLENSDSESDSR